jgi:hypothetical protein
MARSNKNSAKEDDVGLIHGLLNVIHTMGLQNVIELAKENPEDAMFILDSKIIDRAQKFVEWNDIGAQLATEVKSGLSDELQKIKDMQKGKVVHFLSDDERFGTNG